MENSPGLGNLQLNSEREDSNLLHFGLFQLGVPWEISEDDPGPPELLEPLDTKSTGFHPKNPLFFFQMVGEKLAALGGGRGVLKNSRGWDGGELIPQPFPGRIPGIPARFN